MRRLADFGNTTIFQASLLIASAGCAARPIWGHPRYRAGAIFVCGVYQDAAHAHTWPILALCGLLFGWHGQTHVRPANRPGEWQGEGLRLVFRDQGAGAYQVHLVGKRKAGPGTGGGLQGRPDSLRPPLAGREAGHCRALPRLQATPWRKGQTLPFAENQDVKAG